VPAPAVQSGRAARLSLLEAKGDGRMHRLRQCECRGRHGLGGTVARHRHWSDVRACPPRRMASSASETAMAAQGHALFTRAAGSNIPCPQLDFDNGWNEYFAAVYKLPANETVKSKFGAAFGARQRCHVRNAVRRTRHAVCGGQQSVSPPTQRSAVEPLLEDDRVFLLC